MLSSPDNETRKKITINGRPPRIMWLMNHVTLRNSEIAILNALGIQEIYLPKSFPYDEYHTNDSITYDYDRTLSLSQNQIEVLNKQNWYYEPSEEAWLIANSHFDIIFFAFNPEQIRNICRNFQRTIIVRIFSHYKNQTYNDFFQEEKNIEYTRIIRKCKNRLFFAALVDKPSKVDVFSDQVIHLPFEIRETTIRSQWQGVHPWICFICPNINYSNSYKNIYNSFKQNFGNFKHIIVGKQPIYVNDDTVLGYTDKNIDIQNLLHSQLVFYPNTAYNNIDYYPFLAMQLGVPVIYMAGSIIDELMQTASPGQCTHVDEINVLITKILKNDNNLIKKMQQSQFKLLNQLSFESVFPIWQKNITHIINISEQSQTQHCTRYKKKKIAVILPHIYLGGTLRGAILFATALLLGSQENGDEVEVVFGHLDRPDRYNDDTLDQLPQAIQKRAFNWKILTNAEATCFISNREFITPHLSADEYMIPDDNIEQFLDCDLWVIISDRLKKTILPIRPIIIVAYDYIQRYIDVLSLEDEAPFLQSARNAHKVIVTTEFTRQDAVQYVGLKPEKVTKLPILIPDFFQKYNKVKSINNTSQYFIWPTNASIHKNQLNAFEALIIYYEELNGSLKCYVTGDELNLIFSSDSDTPYRKKLYHLLTTNTILKDNLSFFGYLSNYQYTNMLSNAAFLWHTAIIDNGTFCVIEAAFLNVPSLSSDYPPMREIEEQFSLNLMWMNSKSPKDMATKLKLMEMEYANRRSLLPSVELLSTFHVKNLAHYYWSEVKTCL